MTLRSPMAQHRTDRCRRLLCGESQMSGMRIAMTRRTTRPVLLVSAFADRSKLLLDRRKEVEQSHQHILVVKRNPNQHGIQDPPRRLPDLNKGCSRHWNVKQIV
ncbi:hypothetical protein COOONC_18153 [Cooperia oncophora]